MKETKKPKRRIRPLHFLKVWLAQRRVLRRLRARERQTRLNRFLYGLRERTVLGDVEEYFYNTGFFLEYRCVLLGRLLLQTAEWLWRHAASGACWLWGAVRGGFALAFHEFGLPFYYLHRAVRGIRVYVEQNRRRGGALEGLWLRLQYIGRGLLRRWRAIPRSLAYIAPLVALGVSAYVVYTVLNYSYVLAVQVNGETIGYVENSTVFDAGKESVRERISYVGANTQEWNVDTTYFLTVSEQTMDQYQMADAILRASSDEIQEGTAVYLDGVLVGIVEDYSPIEAYLDSRLAPYYSDDPNIEVGFNHTLSQVSGIYFTSSFSTAQEVLAYLDGNKALARYYTAQEGDTLNWIAHQNGLTLSELLEMNPLYSLSDEVGEGSELLVGYQEAVLEVRVVEYRIWQEPIPYETVTSKSDAYEYGEQVVVQAGQDGVQEITATLTYDGYGNLLRQDTAKIEVLQAPVTEQLVIGTHTLAGEAVKYGTGNFIWPVPGYTYVSRWMSSYHKGADIIAKYGLPILASASGTVTVSYIDPVPGRSYGNYVVIDHGNGFTTLYAHASKLLVSVGEYVEQGQVIAEIGSTGDSTANHCHFEMRYKGVLFSAYDLFYPQYR